jgi:1-deoxy-D-xylulose-5-phosphate reductoisomerase
MAGGTAPCTLNAANEIAVHAFLAGRLSFLGIAEVIEGVLDRIGSAPLHSWDSLYEADRAARAAADELIGARA